MQIVFIYTLDADCVHIHFRCLHWWFFSHVYKKSIPITYTSLLFSLNRTKEAYYETEVNATILCITSACKSVQQMNVQNWSQDCFLTHSGLHACIELWWSALNEVANEWTNHQAICCFQLFETQIKNKAWIVLLLCPTHQISTPKILRLCWWILGLKYVLIGMCNKDQKKTIFFLLSIVRFCTLLF
jgi:hypothetical protein